MNNKLKIGAVIHTHELSPFWVEQAKKARLDVLGLHPIGGKDADRFLEEAIKLSKTEDYKKCIADLHDAGIAVEYEMHALSLMVPRSLFKEHPDWFRIDENGQRVADYNVCASNNEVLEHITNEAARLTRLFPSDTHNYHFWIDDVENAECHCPLCRKLSPADQALKIYNAIARGVKSVDPKGRQCYLAYRATLRVPESVQPEENIFLEYAPICRELTKPLTDKESHKNRDETAPLRPLLDFFGRDAAKVLEYWLDNSLLSNWKMPMLPFTLTPEIIAEDVRFYRKHGISSITSFACFLGDEYVKQNGDVPDIAGYTAACRENV